MKIKSVVLEILYEIKLRRKKRRHKSRLIMIFFLSIIKVYKCIDRKSTSRYRVGLAPPLAAPSLYNIPGTLRVSVRKLIICKR